MKFLPFWILLMTLSSLKGATLSFDLEAEHPREINLPWLCDDRAYQSPDGYISTPDSAIRVVKKVTIESLGPEPLLLWSLEVNDRDLVSDQGLQHWLTGDEKNAFWSIYNRWNMLTSHGMVHGKEASDPWGIINVWGKSLCNQDAWAFASMMEKHGILSRRLAMNQHEVNEYDLNHSWAVLDTDQDAFFLKLDGITPASLDDLKNDPLLILRTKPFGRNCAWNPTAAWWNLSLYDLNDSCLFPLSSKRSAVLNREFYLLIPGERAEFWYDENPANTNSEDKVIVSGSGHAEFFYDWKKRKAFDLGMGLPYPIARMHHENLEDKGIFVFHNEEEPAHGQEASLKSILCPASIDSFPEFHAGVNEVVLRAFQGKGRARVTIEYSQEASQNIPPQAPLLKLLSSEGGTPEIALGITNATKVWWQISPDHDFELIPPNFDKLEENTLSDLSITSPLDQTFFVPGRVYYARARYSVQDFWSDWSTPLAFSISKPDAPSIISAEVSANGDEALLRWKPCEGTMLIYGSNRADFLPEPYLGHQAALGILKNGGMSIQWEVDQNHLASVAASDGSARVPLKRFYRLIRSENNVFSIPSSLVRVVGKTTGALPLPTIFQRNKAHGNEGDVIAKPVKFQ